MAHCGQTRLSQENHPQIRWWITRRNGHRLGFHAMEMATLSENPKWVFNDQISVFNDHLQLHGTLGYTHSSCDPPRCEDLIPKSWPGAGIPSIIISLLLKGFLQTSLFSSTNQWENDFSSTNQWEKDIYVTNLRSNAKKTTESFLWLVDDRMTNNWSLNYINYTQPGLTPKWRFSCFIQASSRPAVRPLLPVDLLSAEKPPWWFPRCRRRLHACNVWKVTHAVPCEVLTPGLSFLPTSSGSSLDIFLTNTTTVRWLTLPKKRSSRGDGGLWTGGRVLWSVCNWHHCSIHLELCDAGFHVSPW